MSKYTEIRIILNEYLHEDFVGTQAYWMMCKKIQEIVGRDD